MNPPHRHTAYLHVKMLPVTSLLNLLSSYMDVSVITIS